MCSGGKGRGWRRQGQAAFPPAVPPCGRAGDSRAVYCPTTPVSCGRAAVEREEPAIRAEHGLPVVRKKMPHKA